MVALQRDKDIPAIVNGLGGVGLMGSDAWLLQDGWLKGRLQAVPLLELPDVRFAVCSPSGKAAEVSRKMRRQEPLYLATTYPGLAKQSLGMATRLMVSGGGLEALPTLFPQLDGTFDLVESGLSAKENNLEIVADNVAPVNLQLILPRFTTNLIQST